MEEPFREAPPLFVVDVLVFIRPAFTYGLGRSKIGNFDAEINNTDTAFDNPQADRVTRPPWWGNNPQE